MSAMSFISEPHRGQSMGSTSYSFAISLAQAERQAACGTVVGSVASVCAGTGSMWDWRHPRGAARTMEGHACHRALHREEYNP
jgi:hypothetical protein